MLEPVHTDACRETRIVASLFVANGSHRAGVQGKNKEVVAGGALGAGERVKAAKKRKEEVVEVVTGP